MERCCTDLIFLYRAAGAAEGGWPDAKGKIRQFTWELQPFSFFCDGLQFDDQV
jgi:hypothetical protein